MTEAAEEYLNEHKLQTILKGNKNISAQKLTEILSERPRIDKIAIKDAKLRTFITDDNSDRIGVVSPRYGFRFGDDYRLWGRPTIGCV